MIVISTNLLGMLVKAGISVDTFSKLAIAEGFIQEEVDDLEYMENKIDIYLENQWF